MPRLVVQRRFEGALQIPLSMGSTQKAWEEASAAVAAPYDALQHALAQQPALNGDETGHRTNGAKRWLQDRTNDGLASEQGSNAGPNRLHKPDRTGPITE